ncbi:MAG: hypothetical protein JNK79_01860 [Chitinophagaceae bacterium]|nr:hypothetical protein [Chitinophagaceae bacterium]
MKKFQWPLRAFLFVGVMQLLSCTKTVDTVTNDSLTLETSSDATVDLSKCKIRRLYQKYPGSPGPATLDAVFSYNSAGNPYSVLYQPGTIPDAHYFKYDANKRLTEYIQFYGSWEYNHHYYTYNGNSQIIKDSLILFDEGRPFYTDVATIEYDSQGRVIKETIVNTRNDFGTLSPVRRPTYTYDSRGNLATKYSKSSSYDYKINPLRQSPVFQFIHRNYSMNNASVQAKYNSIGLPLSIERSNDEFFNYFGYTRVEYDCP